MFKCISFEPVYIGAMKSVSCFVCCGAHINKDKVNTHTHTTPKAILAPKALCSATLQYIINSSLHLLSTWYLRLQDNNRGKYFTYRLSLMLDGCVISRRRRRASALYALCLCCGTSCHALSCVARAFGPPRRGRVLVSAGENNSFPCFLSQSCCIRLSCAIWMDVEELRRRSSEALLFRLLLAF